MRNHVKMSFCQYVNMSICQYVRMQLFSLGIKMKVVQNVIRMSNSHYFIMTICLYVNMSVCQYVRMQLFSLGTKMKVVQNVTSLKGGTLTCLQTRQNQTKSMQNFLNIESIVVSMFTLQLQTPLSPPCDIAAIFVTILFNFLKVFCVKTK